MSDRVPQRDDDVVLKLVLPATTEEWAEDFLCETAERYGVTDSVQRTDAGLILTRRVGGNCNALANARSWLAEVEDALNEGDIDPMSLTLIAWSEPSPASTSSGSAALQENPRGEGRND